MIIDVKEINPRVTDRYPYTHRVEVKADAFAAKVSSWLEDNEIPHVKGPWGIYYLNPVHTNLLLLRWS